MSFRFRAASPDGRMEVGVVAASTYERAVAEVRQRGLVPVEVHPVASSASASSASMVAWFGRTSVPEAVALWCRSVGALAGAGVGLDRALSFAQQQVTHPRVREAAQQITTDVRAGQTLGQALQRQHTIIPEVVIALVEAGAQTGALDEALQGAAAWLDEVRAWRSQLRAALLYPLLIAAATVVAAIVLLTAIVPRFTVMLAEAGATLPASTRALVALSDLLRATWWLWLGVVIGGWVGARVWLRDLEARRTWHGWRLTWPLIGKADRAIGTARFCRTLGQLLDGGMPMLGALALARRAVPNAAMAHALQGAEARVRDGSGVARALESILPSMACQLLAVGEESGQLPAMCRRVAEAFDQEVRAMMRTTAALVEPTIILVFGAIVGFVALAMLQAMYGLQAAPWGSGSP